MRECVVCKLRYRGDIDHCPVDGGVLHAVVGTPTEPAAAMFWEEEGTLPDIRPLSSEDTSLTRGPMTGKALGVDGAYVLVDEGFTLRTARVHHAVFRGATSPTLRTLLRMRSPYDKIEGAVDPILYALVELEHSAALTVFESFPDDDGRVYFACGLLRGRPLGERLARGAEFRPSEVLPILTQVSSLTAAAHDHEIVHGMLSPEDVWADPQLRVTVVGFGDLALTQRATATLSAPEHRPRYRADNVDFWRKEADVVAIGGLAYELIVGSPPGNRHVDLGRLGPVVRRALGWEGPIPSAQELADAISEVARLAPVSRRVPTAIVEAPPDPNAQEQAAELSGEALKKALEFAGLVPLAPAKHPKGLEDLFEAFSAYYQERGRGEHLRYLDCIRTRYVPVAQMKSRVPYYVAYSEALELHLRCFPDLLKTGVRDYVAYLIDDLLEIDDEGAQQRARSLGKVCALLSG